MCAFLRCICPLVSRTGCPRSFAFGLDWGGGGEWYGDCPWHVVRPGELMILYFLRHAEAEEDANDDASRRLTRKGVDQAERVARYCTKFELSPELILSSPVVRARQTGEVVAKRLEVGRFELADWLACGMAPETCFRRLSELEGIGSVMLVGHEPDFSEVLAAFLGSGDGGVLHLRKSSLTGVSVSAFARGGGVLEFLVPAKLM